MLTLSHKEACGESTIAAQQAEWEDFETVWVAVIGEQTVNIGDKKLVRGLNEKVSVENHASTYYSSDTGTGCVRVSMDDW